MAKQPQNPKAKDSTSGAVTTELPKAGTTVVIKGPTEVNSAVGMDIVPQNPSVIDKDTQKAIPAAGRTIVINPEDGREPVNPAGEYKVDYPDRVVTVLANGRRITNYK